MSNYCTNQLTILGRPSDVHAFVERAVPDEADEVQSIVEIFVGDEVDVAWDIEPQLAVHWPFGGLAIITFDSEWGPPLEGIQLVSGQVPDLILGIDFVEPDTEVLGAAGYQAGGELFRAFIPEENWFDEWNEAPTRQEALALMLETRKEGLWLGLQGRFSDGPTEPWASEP